LKAREFSIRTAGSILRFNRRPMRPSNFSQLKFPEFKTEIMLQFLKKFRFHLWPLSWSFFRGHRSAWIALILAAAVISIAPANATAAQTEFVPGEIWLDTDGAPINAHGGGVLFHGGVYYWYGEFKTGKT
jgi:hypothetical protein